MMCCHAYLAESGAGRAVASTGRNQPAPGSAPAGLHHAAGAGAERHPRYVAEHLSFRADSKLTLYYIVF